jgi:hypothetical protein
MAVVQRNWASFIIAGILEKIMIVTFGYGACFSYKQSWTPLRDFSSFFLIKLLSYPSHECTHVKIYYHKAPSRCFYG